MSLSSRIRGALSRAVKRGKESAKNIKAGRRPSGKPPAFQKNIQTARAKREAQKERSAQQRREIVETAKAVITPRQQRTPEQLERTRSVARFIGGASVAVATGGAVGAVARGVGKRLGAKAVARGISKKSVERAGKLATGGLLTAGVVGTGVQAKRIAKGEAGAFETGFTLGGAGVLARPTGRVIGAVRQYVRPKVIVPKVKSIVTTAGVREGKVTRTISDIAIKVGRKKPVTKRAFGLQVTDKETTFGAIKVGKEITPFGATKVAPDISAQAFKPTGQRVQVGFAGTAVDIRAPTFRETRGAFAGEAGRGIFRTRIYKAPKTPTDTGIGRRTRQKLKTQEKQLQGAITETAQKEQAKVVEQFRTRETGRIRRGARTRLRSGIRQITPQVATQIGGQITRTRTGLITDTFAPQKTRTITKAVTQTITPTRVPAPIVDTITPTRPTGTITPTRITGRIGGAPFIPLFRFGGAGAGGRTEARIGKEVGGRFTRSFSAEVLGIKAPRKRKIKRKYTGFELRI